ncbi:right-handed parallel beta-helix repeat-containing protein, partial [candidate division KSB1 bacterium]
YSYAGTSAAGLVSNNFISITAGTGTSYGLYAYYSDKVTYINNSIYISDASTTSRSLYQYNTSGNTNGQTFLNNIFANSGNGYAAYYNTPTSVANSDYNCFYSTASNLAYWSGAHTTLSSLQSASGMDAHSVAVNPGFVSATDLHVNNVTIDGGALASPLVSIDIDGDPRDSLAPDIGADEFMLIGDDAGVFSLVEPIAPCPGTTSDVKVELRNFGTDTLFSANIHWMVNTVMKDSVVFNDTLLPGASTIITLDTLTFYQGTLYNMTFWSSLPNGIPDLQTNNDTLTITGMKTALGSGTYTIGPDPSDDYVSFNAAVNDLNAFGICGPVVFEVDNGTYNESVSLIEVLGASAINTITFKSASGNNTQVTLTAASGSVFKLDGADYVTVKNISIIGTGAAYMAVEITGGAMYNTFEGNRLQVPQTTSSSYRVVYDYNTLNHFNTYRNNIIYGGYYGMYIYGVGSTSWQKGTVIEGNDISGFYYYGMLLYYLDSTQIIGNYIHDGTYVYNYGIYAYYNFNGFKIDKNNISLSASSYSYALRVYYCNYYSYAGNSAAGTVSNNFISITAGSGTNYGLYAYYSNNVGYYNNSIHISAGNTSSRALYQYNTSSNTTGQTFVNNIFSNSSGGYAAYYSSSAYVNNVDYNCYYTTGTTYFVYWNGNQPNLTALQNASGKDSHSKSFDPLFYSATDLHTDNVNLWHSATPVPAYVTDDYDGEPRDTVAPCIGADEFTIPPYNATAVALFTLGKLPKDAGSPHTVIAVVKNKGMNPLPNFEVKLDITGANAFSDTVTFDTLQVGQTDTIYFDPFTPTAYGFNTITLNLPADDDSTDNMLTYYQEITDSLYGFADTSAKTLNLGFNTGAGLFLVKYHMNGSKVISAVNAYITNSGTLGQQLYGVVLDTAGNLLSAGPIDTIDASEQESWVRFPISSPNATTTVNTDFYVGFAQTVGTSGYYPCGVQDESPGRWDAYFYSTSLTGGSLVEDNSFGRFMIDAVVTDPSPRDASAIAFTGPAGGCGLSTTELVTLEIQNIGLDSIISYDSSLMASFALIDSIGNFVSMVNEYVFATIPPATNYYYTFTGTANLHVPIKDSTFQLVGWVDYTGDPYDGNDTTFGTVESEYQPPDPIVTSPITIQYATSTTLSAISNDTLLWYDDPIDTVALATGPFFTTPILYDTTNFWVEASNGSTGVGGNIAPMAIASASACNTGPCTTLNDLDYGVCGTQSMWIPTSSPPSSTPGVDWMRFDWPSSVNIESMTIHHAQDNARFLTGFTLQTYSGGNWVTQFTISGLPMQCINNVPFPIVLNTDNFRITSFQMQGTGQTSNPNFREIEIFEALLQGCTSNRIPLIVQTTSPPPVDAGIYMITNPVISTVSNTPTDIDVVIKNYGTNTLSSTTINYSVNGVLQTPYSWTGTLLQDSLSVPITISTDTFAGGVYCIDAWTSMPNSVADTVNSNDTSQSCFNSCLSGTYTVGTLASDFPTLADAKMALDSAGICGPVVFNIAAGTYNIPGGQVIFNEINGASAVNTVTFQGATGDSTDVIITGAGTSSSASFVLKLNGADYMRFKHMTIKTTSSSYPGVIELAGGADYNEFSNNEILSYPNTTSSYGRCVYDYNTLNEYNVYRNNLMQYGYYGMYVYGSSSTTKQKGTVIEGNIIKDYYYYGTYFYYQDSLTFHNNSVENGSSSGSVYGTRFYYCDRNRITNNRINIHATSTHYGMYAYYCAGTTTEPNLIANNFISLTGSGTGTWYGIYMYNHTNTNFYHNTMNLTGGSTTAGRCIYQSSGSNINMKNNIFVNTGGGVTYYIATPTAIASADYNDHYVTGSYLAYWSGNRTDLSALQTASSKESHSLSVDPGFVSATDLHVTTFDLNAAATPVPDVMYDIDGQLRDTVMPDIGADEFTPPPNDAGVASIDSPTSPAITGTQNIKVTIKNYGLDTLTSATIHWTINGTAQTNYPWTGSLPTAISDTGLVLGSYNFPSGQTSIKAWTTNPNSQVDGWAFNDTAYADIIACTGPLSGTYTVGGSNPDFTSFGAALYAASSCGVGGPVTFNVAPGNYMEQLNITTIPGASLTNSVTFKGATGDSTDVVLTYSSAAYTLKFDGADYIAFKSMTITSAAGGTIVEFANGANYNEISNCIIETAVSTSSTAMCIYDYNTANEYNIIKNNRLFGGYYSIYMYGISSSNKEAGNIIEGNTIEGFYYYGLFLYYQEDIQIRGNYIENGTNSASVYGVRLYYCDNIEFTKNHLNIHATSTHYGIYAYYNAGTSTKHNLFANNFVALNGSGTGTWYGIYMYNHSYTDFYNNSFHLTGGSTSTGRCIYQSSGSNINLKNNILVNTGGGYTFYISTPTAILSSDYNDLYTTGSILAYWSGAATNLATLQSYSYKDSNSVSIDPGFSSASDLHIVTSAVNGLGIPLIPDVVDDIDGELRDTLAPDIGADEFTPLNKDLAAVQFTEPSDGYDAVGSQKDVKMAIRNQ